MWKSEYLAKMLQIYEKSQFINEVIIIDNFPTNRINISASKVKIHSKGKNIYVNPAWNLGVSLAVNPYIIVANDDLLFKESDFTNLINSVIPYLVDNTVVGPSPNCFKQVSSKPSFGNLKIEAAGSKFSYGFGTFMIMKKSSYTIIPEDILIFHGDVIQHKTNKIHLFSGIEIVTPMSTTLKSDPELHRLAKLDHSKSLKHNINSLKKSN
jgi:hypothetical protein